MQAATPSDSRLDSLEVEIKRLREQGSQNAVETALGQVRALALRSTTPNATLVAALEHLSDTAIVHGHSDCEHYKMVLKACRDNEGEGPLQTLITKLLGTEAAKKVATGLESWRKAVAKSKPTGGDKTTPVNNPQPLMQHPAYPSTPPPFWMSQNPWLSFPPYGMFPNPHRGRGRGRGRGAYNPSSKQNPRLCFNCKSPDHIVSECTASAK